MTRRRSSPCSTSCPRHLRIRHKWNRPPKKQRLACAGVAGANACTPGAAPPLEFAPPLEDSSGQLPSLSHHERRCKICSHPEREDIEADFLHWFRSSGIAFDYGVSYRAIHRHARALGLYAQRGRNLRYAIGHLIENAESVKPTGDTVLRAIRAYSFVTDSGEWNEPAAHVVVSSGSAVYPRAASIPAPVYPACRDARTASRMERREADRRTSPKPGSAESPTLAAAPIRSAEITAGPPVEPAPPAPPEAAPISGTAVPDSSAPESAAQDWPPPELATDFEAPDRTCCRLENGAIHSKQSIEHELNRT